MGGYILTTLLDGKLVSHLQMSNTHVLSTPDSISSKQAYGGRRLHR
jgi:hypothetical protein